ncbi:MAG: DUF3147 family protein [Proteobacteria bacterium]|nr:DUF3147 family protein [Pseudomonadota bacterium]
MYYYLIKLVVSAVLIVAVSEIAKRNSGVAALLASLPLTSLLAFVWMQQEAAGSEKIAALSLQIFWLVLPSLPLFLLLAYLLRHGWSFWPALACACTAAASCYLLMLPLLRKFGMDA